LSAARQLNSLDFVIQQSLPNLAPSFYPPSSCLLAWPAGAMESDHGPPRQERQEDLGQEYSGPKCSCQLCLGIGAAAAARHNARRQPARPRGREIGPMAFNPEGGLGIARLSSRQSPMDSKPTHGLAGFLHVASNPWVAWKSLWLAKNLLRSGSIRFPHRFEAPKEWSGLFFPIYGRFESMGLPHRNVQAHDRCGIVTLRQIERRRRRRVLDFQKLM
jgi:hypothetical protein